MLYKDTLREWCPWFFLMDHPNYTRWVSVHVMDMDNLEKANPDVYEEFNTEGRFMVSVSGRPFSTIGLDQNHEQLNAKLKEYWDNTLLLLITSAKYSTIINYLMKQCVTPLHSDMYQSLESLKSYMLRHIVLF